ncbi:MAG: tRNA 2-selenouridine(34) synthase MnmH [Betaproteobacteria bacterium]|nr:tRNA 2-selenouridine(34) synthase MnmH [Betaproteobacteria bacterium]
MRLLPLSLDDLGSFDAIIDVRSPSEFAEDHLPGAVNFPVLNDSERVRVGTLYKQSSAFEAKKIGAAIVARNIASHIEVSFLGKPKRWKPLVYCWRGGSRSGAMSHVLRSIGWPTLQLEGGYKAWRSQVRSDLESLPAKYGYQVICGRTGSGKSRLLDALASNGQQVLDLEKLAAHKGSVLGDLPDEAQPAQKMFESRIWVELSRFNPAKPVYVEAESKKVGSLRVPETLIQRMRISPCYDVLTPEALRVQLLREEYTHLIADTDLLFAKLDCLKALHSIDRIDAWKSLAHSARWDEFVADMLVHHYDPAYRRSMFRNYIHAEIATPLPIASISASSFLNVARALPG